MINYAKLLFRCRPFSTKNDLLIFHDNPNCGPGLEIPDHNKIYLDESPAHAIFCRRCADCEKLNKW